MRRGLRRALAACVVLTVLSGVTGTAAASAAATPASSRASFRPGLMALAMHASTSGAYGATLVPGCQWATFVPKCQNLDVRGNGASFDNASCGVPNNCAFGPEFQCTELAQRYAYYAWDEPADWSGYGGANGAAYQMWAAGPALPEPLQQLAQGGGVPPQQGDLLVFDRGWLGSYWDGNGHVAVVRDVGPTYVDIVQENGTPSGMDRLGLSGSTISANGYTPVIGWLHNPLTSASGASRLSVAAQGGQQIAFWQGADGHLREVWTVGNSWTGPVDWTAVWKTPALLTSAPDVVWAPDGSQSVYWRGPAGHLWLATFTAATGWTAPLDLSATWSTGDLLLLAPSAAVTPDGQQIIFWQGVNGDLFETWPVAGAWQPPTDWTVAWGDVGPLNSAPSAVVTSSGQQVVYWQSADGHLWEARYAGAWTGPLDVSLAWHGQGLLASAPSAVVAADGTRVVFWQGTDGHLHEAWNNGSWNGPFDWDALGSLNSAPSAVLTGGKEMVYWQTPGGDLADATWNGAWSGPADWTAAWRGMGVLGSAPTVTVAPDGQQLVFWRGAEGHLWEAWFSGGSWHGPTDWTRAWNGAGSLASAPSVALTPDGKTQTVFWEGTDGHLWEAWYSGGWNGPVDWTATWHSTNGLGSAPSVVVSPDGRQQLVFWRGAEGHLWEAWFDGAWNGPVDWSAGASGLAATLTSAPSAAITADGNEQLVYWQDSAGHLREAWYSHGWHGPIDWVDVSNGTSSLGSAPNALVGATGDQQVFWRGQDGHLWETWWGGSFNGAIDWASAGGLNAQMTSSPSAASYGGGRIVFWEGPGGHLDEAWSGDAWTAPVDWTEIGPMT